MSGDERELITSIGPLHAAVSAINLAMMSGGYGEMDLDEVENLDEDELASLIAALANLSALLARVVARTLGRSRDHAATILTTIRDDQEVRAARIVIEDLDDGLPFS